MRLNRKGFTLVELLVTIVVVGLVVGLSTFGVIRLIKSSEEEVVVLSENNLKEAARIYSTEASNDSWKKKVDYERRIKAVPFLRLLQSLRCTDHMLSAFVLRLML